MVRLAVAGGVVSVLFATSSAYAQPSSERGAESLPPPSSPHAAFIAENCLKCHSEEASTAMALFSGLFLDRVDVTDVAEAPIVWEKVVLKLRTGMMPPASEPRPDRIEQERFVSYLESELDGLAARNPNPGRPALHRLNRSEYENAIRDLLALEVDAETLLPADDSTFGFDNVAASLGISPVLIERYANAAAKISRLAVGDTSLTPEQQSYYVPSFLIQTNRIEGLPFGTRGGMRIEHHFPVDAEYTLSAELMSAVDGIHIGNGVPNEQLEISLDGERVALFDISKPQRPERDRNAEDPAETKAAAEDPAESSAAAEDPAAAPAEDGESLAEADEAPARSEPEEPEARKWEVTLPIPAGPHTVTATFLKKNHAPIEDTIRQPFNSLLDPLFNGHPEVTLIPHLGGISIDGPYNVTGPGETPSRSRIFTCRPQRDSEIEPCAREILSALAHRAYRQPPATEHVSVLMDFFEQGRRQGGFEKGIEVALQRILSSPRFVFRFERAPADVKPGEPYRISDLELASRLSFFLWSSIPDDELLELASRGRLSRPAVLAQQVERMLADPRAAALTENFAGQWLYLRNLDIKDASSHEYPDFDDTLRSAFRRETELLFEHVVREDRSLLELFTADYTFVNERLAKHYGIPGIYGSHFRKVPIDGESRRGVLGHGSVLLVTSQPNRTSPVTRGVWILENVLGAHVPSPPMATPPLEDAAGDVDPDELSVRELMELHRSKPFCEGCHKIMDPVGLAMENFDVIGQWRDVENGTPIDGSGRLVDGTMIDGPVELREALLRYDDQIMRNAIEKMLTYALGRGLEHYDMPVVRAIARQAAAEDYRFSAIVHGIVTSVPFLMRSPEPAGETVAAGR